jgi:hypothetical protein
LAQGKISKTRLGKQFEGTMRSPRSIEPSTAAPRYNPREWKAKRPRWWQKMIGHIFGPIIRWRRRGQFPRIWKELNDWTRKANEVTSRTELEALLGRPIRYCPAPEYFFSCSFKFSELDRVEFYEPPGMRYRFRAFIPGPDFPPDLHGFDVSAEWKLTAVDRAAGVGKLWEEFPYSLKLTPDMDKVAADIGR